MGKLSEVPFVEEKISEGKLSVWWEYTQLSVTLKTVYTYRHPQRQAKTLPVLI